MIITMETTNTFFLSWTSKVAVTCKIENKATAVFRVCRSQLFESFFNILEDIDDFAVCALRINFVAQNFVSKLLFKNFFYPIAILRCVF